MKILSMSPQFLMDKEKEIIEFISKTPGPSLYTTLLVLTSTVTDFTERLKQEDIKEDHKNKTLDIIKNILQSLKKNEISLDEYLKHTNKLDAKISFTLKKRSPYVN